MLSIIVSSYRQNIFDQFEKSLSQTIGTEYQLIKVKNKGNFGICEAYNKGIEKINYDYVFNLTFTEDYLVEELPKGYKFKPLYFFKVAFRVLLRKYEYNNFISEFNFEFPDWEGKMPWLEVDFKSF